MTLSLKNGIVKSKPSIPWDPILTVNFGLSISIDFGLSTSGGPKTHMILTAIFHWNVNGLAVGVSCSPLARLFLLAKKSARLVTKGIRRIKQTPRLPRDDELSCQSPIEK